VYRHRRQSGFSGRIGARFTRNWAKVASGEYPRFATLYPAFESDFNEFVEFLKDEGLPAPSITQCELTYVNNISADESWARHGQLDEVITPWSGALTEGFLDEPEDVVINIRYVIPSDSGVPIGRLNVAIQPAWTPETTPMVLMTLTARGAPVGADMDGVKQFMATAHEWIVRGFSTLTTSTMHKTWGRHT
jgi:uncharacterized protein (TIGR04255 family)